jgi:hypothetical protein
MHYPTQLFLKLADHTYVRCGTGGRAWACWGGKTGGTVLRSGSGSTKQADAIAEPNEHANIKCYLINGVCDQAANRILWPAWITVRGARGYNVSWALYGTYGRPGAWFFCPGAFNKHAGVTGDLPECMPDVPPEGAHERDEAHVAYLREELALYAEARPLFEAATRDREAVVDFSVRLFRHMAAYQLGRQFEGAVEQRLLDIRRQTEHDRSAPEDAYAGGDVDPAEFAREIDAVTERFQDDMAGALTAEQYRMLFALAQDERVTLADPEIVDGLARPGTGEEE